MAAPKAIDDPMGLVPPSEIEDDIDQAINRTVAADAKEELQESLSSDSDSDSDELGKISIEPSDEDQFQCASSPPKQPKFQQIQRQRLGELGYDDPYNVHVINFAANPAVFDLLMCERLWWILDPLLHHPDKNLVGYLERNLIPLIKIVCCEMEEYERPYTELIERSQSKIAPKGYTKRLVEIPTVAMQMFQHMNERVWKAPALELFLAPASNPSADLWHRFGPPGYKAWVELCKFLGADLSKSLTSHFVKHNNNALDPFIEHLEMTPLWVCFSHWFEKETSLEQWLYHMKLFPDLADLFRKQYTTLADRTKWTPSEDHRFTNFSIFLSELVARAPFAEFVRNLFSEEFVARILDYALNPKYPYDVSLSALRLCSRLSEVPRSYGIHPEPSTALRHPYLLLWAPRRGIPLRFAGKLSAVVAQVLGSAPPGGELYADLGNEPPVRSGEEKCPVDLILHTFRQAKEKGHADMRTVETLAMLAHFCRTHAEFDSPEASWADFPSRGSDPAVASELERLGLLEAAETMARALPHASVVHNLVSDLLHHYFFVPALVSTEFLQKIVIVFWEELARKPKLERKPTDAMQVVSPEENGSSSGQGNDNYRPFLTTVARAMYQIYVKPTASVTSPPPSPRVLPPVDGTNTPNPASPGTPDSASKHSTRKRAAMDPNAELQLGVARIRSFLEASPGWSDVVARLESSQVATPWVTPFREKPSPPGADSQLQTVNSVV